MGMLVADEMTDTANLKCDRSCHVQHDRFNTSKSGGSRCLYDIWRCFQNIHNNEMLVCHSFRRIGG